MGRGKSRVAEPETPAPIAPAPSRRLRSSASTATGQAAQKTSSSSDMCAERSVSREGDSTLVAAGQPSMCDACLSLPCKAAPPGRSCRPAPCIVSPDDPKVSSVVLDGIVSCILYAHEGQHVFTTDASLPGSMMYCAHVQVAVRGVRRHTLICRRSTRSLSRAGSQLAAQSNAAASLSNGGTSSGSDFEPESADEAAEAEDDAVIDMTLDDSGPDVEAAVEAEAVQRLVSQATL